jgi:hypothetical protein
MEEIIEPLTFAGIVEDDFAEPFTIQTAIVSRDDIGLVGEVLSNHCQSFRARLDHFPRKMVQVNDRDTI